MACTRSGCGTPSTRSTASGTPRSPPTPASGRRSPTTGSRSTPPSGEITELAPYAGAVQRQGGADRPQHRPLEAEWRAAHPGEEPGPRVRQAWDRRAWAKARPDKVVPKDGAAMVAAWNDELRRLGYRDPRRPAALITPQDRGARPRCRGRAGAVRGSARSGRRGTPPTFAARSSSGSPRPDSSPTHPSGSSRTGRRADLRYPVAESLLQRRARQPGQYVAEPRVQVAAFMPHAAPPSYSISVSCHISATSEHPIGR